LKFEEDTCRNSGNLVDRIIGETGEMRRRRVLGGCMRVSG